MNHFEYRNGVLHAEAVNLVDLADAVGTPFYCYSTATLERHYRVFSEAFAGANTLICYALKANSRRFRSCSSARSRKTRKRLSRGCARAPTIISKFLLTRPV